MITRLVHMKQMNRHDASTLVSELFKDHEEEIECLESKIASLEITIDVLVKQINQLKGE